MHGRRVRGEARLDDGFDNPDSDACRKKINCRVSRQRTNVGKTFEEAVEGRVHSH